MTDQIDLRSEAALDAFIAGLDSPNHSPESRRSWCRLFLRDAAMGHLRLFTVPTISDESRRIIADDLHAFGITSPKIEEDRTKR